MFNYTSRALLPGNFEGQAEEEEEDGMSSSVEHGVNLEFPIGLL